MFALQLRTMPPRVTVLNGPDRPLHLGDECDVFGCYWYVNNSNNYRAVAWALPVFSCTIGESYVIIMKLLLLCNQKVLNSVDAK